ncbi:sensor histidine kinase [Mucilaginibacter sp. E4BP6]|uniref:sensor histidine kinase n=1 Tax=Mucilaginibacter sp. E4BP6 TaxID=2723089 RepID=UPI0015C8BA55|nr:HAMP domain-containing sensor histidine kinase [Mucilaginibacter sp. E4BP6]NYE66063.1 signal transduction histidine kinase [Mucilaginibacter sp. E4BP6]
MNKRLTFIFFVAVFTGCGIIFFQLFWLSQVFTASNRNFRKIASDALQKTINNYQMDQTSDIIHSKPGDSLTVDLDSTALRQPDTKILDYRNLHPIIKNARHFEPKLTNSNVEMIKVMIARVVAQVTNKPVILSTLKVKYKEELLKNGLKQSFILSLVPPESKIAPDDVVGYSGLSKNSAVVKATFNLGSLTIIKRNGVSLFISIGLIFLTSGSLYYMWYVIRQQVLLDEIKNGLINNVTHEFRTPIAILQSTHEAIDNFTDPADFEKTLRYIRANRTVLKKLEININRILDIASYENKSRQVILEHIPLKILIQDVIAGFELGHGIIISFNYRMSNELIKTDQFAITTIVSNLVDNALKYSGEQPAITVNVNQINNGWNLEVIDNGSGIPRQYIDLIFDKFYRVPTGNVHDIKGYGIGLSYVKMLTELLKGHLSVKSILGEGTKFTIEFPIND